MKHYLMSVPILGAGHLHCYFMTNRRKDLEGARNRLLHEAEKICGGPLALPVILETELGDSANDVRQILIENGPSGFAETLAAATDFHITILGTPKGNEADKRLMAIH